MVTNGAAGTQGPQGPAGVGIQSVTGPVSSGSTDTYTIHLTDGTSTTFTVTNNFASQVNSDWNATSGVAEILNKPSIPTQSDIQAMIDQRVGGLSDLIAQQQARIDSLQELVGTRPTVTITSNNPGDKINFPSVTAQVTSTGGDFVLAKGFCWSTTQNPSIQSNNYVIVDTTAFTFKALLTSLTNLTATYYVRAFATNASGTSYSDQITIHRNNSYSVPRSGRSIVYLNEGDELWVYDVGGPNGNYNEDNLNGYLTVASNNQNYKVMMVEGTYATESANYDYLEVYEGDVSNATTGYLKRFGGSGSVVPLAPSPSNSNLTLRFRSDGSQSAYAGFAVKFIVVSRPCYGSTTVTDYDGNVYNTVEIGEQCWMKENLRTTHYANGAAITQGSTNQGISTTRYYYPSSSPSIYGLYYNWSAAANNISEGTATTASSKVQGVCPNGWHLPAKDEFVTLYNYVTSNTSYGPSAKALASTTNWTSSSTANTPGNNPGANNTTGFNAKPAGDVSFPSSQYVVEYFGSIAYFWTSTRSSQSSFYFSPSVGYNSTNFSTSLSTSRSAGMPVRCVMN